MPKFYGQNKKRVDPRYRLNESESEEKTGYKINRWKPQLSMALLAVPMSGWNMFIKLMKDKTVGQDFLNAAHDKLDIPIVQGKTSQRAVYMKFLCKAPETNPDTGKKGCRKDQYRSTSERLGLADTVCGGPCKEA